MSDKSKGANASIHRINPSVHNNGCVCHLMHVAAEKASRTVIIYNVEELLIDIYMYYHLEKSSKPKQTLKEFQVLCNVDTKKIIKHVSTRWLSLGQCLSRLMTRWEPLSSFFRTDTQNLESLKVHLNKSCSSS